MPTLAIPSAVLQTPPPVVTLDIPDDENGTEQTISAMQQIIEQGTLSARVRGTAIRITSGVKSFDTPGLVRIICLWTQRNIKFRNDPVSADSLHTPDVTLDYHAGDCDDITILICSLLGSLGIETRLVAEATDPRRPEAFTHVYPEALVKGRWIACDMARPGAAIGKRPARSYRRRVWSLAGAFSGLGQTTVDPNAQIVGATGTGIADIIAAMNPQSSYTAVSSQGAYGGSIVPGGSSATISGNTWLLLGGAALLLILMMRR